MLKTIGKILIILAAAGIVCGALYAYVNASGHTFPGGFERGFNGPQNGFQPHDRQAGGFRGGDFGERGGRDPFSLTRGLTGMVRNTGILAVIMAVVILGQKTWRSLFRRRVTPPGR